MKGFAGLIYQLIETIQYSAGNTNNTYTYESKDR